MAVAANLAANIVLARTGERREHQNVATIWKNGIRTQDGEYAHNQHCGGKQEVLHGQGRGETGVEPTYSRRGR